MKFFEKSLVGFLGKYLKYLLRESLVQIFIGKPHPSRSNARSSCIVIDHDYHILPPSVQLFIYLFLFQRGCNMLVGKNYGGGSISLCTGCSMMGCPYVVHTLVTQPPTPTNGTRAALCCYNWCWWTSIIHVANASSRGVSNISPIRGPPILGAVLHPIPQSASNDFNSYFFRSVAFLC